MPGAAQFFWGMSASGPKQLGGCPKNGGGGSAVVKRKGNKAISGGDYAKCAQTSGLMKVGDGCPSRKLPRLPLLFSYFGRTPLVPFA